MLTATVCNGAWTPSPLYTLLDGQNRLVGPRVHSSGLTGVLAVCPPSGRRECVVSALLQLTVQPPRSPLHQPCLPAAVLGPRCPPGLAPRTCCLLCKARQGAHRPGVQAPHGCQQEALQVSSLITTFYKGQAPEGRTSGVLRGSARFTAGPQGRKQGLGSPDPASAWLCACPLRVLRHHALFS